MATFGDRLKEERERRKLSQKELADKLNISQSSVAYYEKDKKQPPQNTLIRIADFFEVSVDYLLGRSDVWVRPELIREALGTKNQLSANDTLLKLSEQAKAMGLSISDPKFQELVFEAIDLLRKARGQD